MFVLMLDLFSDKENLENEKKRIKGLETALTFGFVPIV